MAANTFCIRSGWTKIVPPLAFLLLLPGCVWLRLYETKTQLAQFDSYFTVGVDDRFTLNFKHPLLYSSDFDDLLELKASRTKPPGAVLASQRLAPKGLPPGKGSSNLPLPAGQAWYYDFYKIDTNGRFVDPAVALTVELEFDRDDRLSAWSLSPMFLAMMPPEFLEASLRSLGSAEVNKGKRQLRASSEELANRVRGKLPRREAIVARLGDPLQIGHKSGEVLYVYHFRLKTGASEKSDEDRALSVVNLYFDPLTEELTKMSGRFAGLKVSIDYRKMAKREEKTTETERQKHLEGVAIRS